VYLTPVESLNFWAGTIVAFCIKLNGLVFYFNFDEDKIELLKKAVAKLVLKSIIAIRQSVGYIQIQWWDSNY